MGTTSSSRRRHTRVAATIGAVAAVGITLGGCGVSEITGLAQAGNLNVIFLSAATVDTLTEKGYTISVAPVCTESDTTVYTCKGMTGDGKEISVTTSNVTKSDADYQVSVGGTLVHSGNLLDDLDKNMLVQQ